MGGLFNQLKGLFSKDQEEIKYYSFTQPKSFRGFKKFPMDVAIDPEAKANNEKFRDVDISGASITFYDVAPDRINVKLNDTYIGFISKADKISDLRSGKITDFYVKFEEDHIFDGANEEYRYRAHLLAKYKE